MTRHTFIWTATSMRIETRMANANAAPIWTVNVAVCVMKPGPMAEVAMRNMAPSSAVRRVALAARESVFGAVPEGVEPSGPAWGMSAWDTVVTFVEGARRGDGRHEALGRR